MRCVCKVLTLKKWKRVYVTLVKTTQVTFFVLSMFEIEQFLTGTFSDASLELRHLLESNGYQPPTLFIELLELTKESNFRHLFSNLKQSMTLGATMSLLESNPLS